MHPSLESLPVIALIKQYIFEIKKKYLYVQFQYYFIPVLLHARTQLQTRATPRFLHFYSNFCSFYHLDISSFHYPPIWQSVTLAHSICALPETCPHFCLGNPLGCWGYQNWGLWVDWGFKGIVPEFFSSDQISYFG